MRNAYYQLLNYINMSQTQDVFYYSAVTILDHLKDIPRYSITQVADMCFASTATISRLIRRLNYPTYNEFKQDVIYTLEEVARDDPIHFDDEPVDRYPHVDYQQLKEDFFDGITANLNYAYETIQPSDLMEVVQYIDQAKRVIFLGYNFCQTISSQLQSTLSIYKKPVLAKTNEQLQFKVLQETQKDDLIILTTITGNYFRYKPEAMELFKCSPARKIVITQDAALAKANHADKIICVGERNASYIGKFSVMMVYELLEMYYRASHTPDF